VLIMRGTGFEIETQGQALDNAPAGGVLRVQIKEGTILSAKAIADGLAEAK
jgi:flagella basal body P-ring formation protein FlgA